MAPRTSARSERLFCRLSVIEGNMCSQGYGGGRTERSARTGNANAETADFAEQRGKCPERLQSILQEGRKRVRSGLHEVSRETPGNTYETGAPRTMG